MKRVLSLLLLTGSAYLFCCGTALAQDWPQWRGPGRDGTVASFRAPAEWPVSLTAAWKVTIGEGHSQPLVAGNKVFTFARQDEREVASCIDLSTGKVLWSQSYPVAYTMNEAATDHGKGPKSTPVISNRRLYTLGITGVLSCYDASSGKLTWRKEFAERFKTTAPDYGTAMSPLIDRGLLIAHLGGHDLGAIIAFDAATGAEKWSWNGDGPAYASPVVVELAGVRQIVTQTQKFLVGIAAATGELLWQVPFTTEYDVNSVTPVIYKQTIVYSGAGRGTSAIRIVKDGARYKAERVWETSDVFMAYSTPVLRGDFLFGLSAKQKGEYFCMDARSGKTTWKSNGRQGEHASILIAGDLLFLLNNEAELTLAAASADQFQSVKKYTVATSPTWAHPVLLGNRILIKDKTTLALLNLQ